MSILRFASFHLGGSELALSLEHLQEVIDMPEQISPLPLAPEHLKGVFDLRGTAIPLVDGAALLGFPASLSKDSQKVAIICFEGTFLGLIFDKTSEIIAASAQEISHLEKSLAGKQAPIKSILKLNQGQRLVEVLDPLEIIKLGNVPEIPDQLKESEQVQQHKGQRLQFISFQAGELTYGLPIASIQEIIAVPEIKRSVLAVDACLGIVNLRSMIIPLLDFQLFLKAKKADSAEEHKRVIILRIEHAQVGILVDKVSSITSCFADEILPMDASVSERGYLEGILPQGEGQLLVINEGELLNSSEVYETIKGHGALYGKNDRVEVKKKAFQRQSYLSFKLDYMLSTRLSSIEEVVMLNDDLVRPPGALSYMVGFLARRGEVINVIDLRSFYGLAPLPRTADSRVLVVQGVSAKFGLLVDSVEAIDTVDEAKRIQIPLFFAQDIFKNLHGDMNEVAEMTDLNGKKTTHMFLNVRGLLERLEKAHSAQSLGSQENNNSKVA